MVDGQSNLSGANAWLHQSVFICVPTENDREDHSCEENQASALIWHTLKAIKIRARLRIVLLLRFLKGEYPRTESCLPVCLAVLAVLRRSFLQKRLYAFAAIGMMQIANEMIAFAVHLLAHGVCWCIVD